MADSTVVPTVHPVSSGHPELVLCIVIPLILVLLGVAAVLLAILIFWSIRKRHLKQTKNYRPVPKSDSIDGLTNALRGSSSGRGLPFPPRVQITTPISPSIQPGYATASQLSNQFEMNSRDFQARYPFIQHSIPSTDDSKEEKRPPRLRTRRKGNHKHIRGRNVILKRSETVESEHSPIDEEDTSRDPSPYPSPHPPHPREFLVPAKQSNSPPRAAGGSRSEVFLAIRYTETNDLVIRVERVKSLPLRDDGTEVDGYIRLYFTPVFPTSKMSRRTSRTHTERRSSEPVFEEEIKYDNMSVDELLQTTLHVEALDFKSFGKHSLLGLNEIALNTLNLTSEVTNVTVPLRPPPEISNFNGTVLLSLSFEPDNRKLTVIILRAKDLNNNIIKETDPVAKIAISLKERVLAKLKTKKKTGSCSPIFNEAVSCTVGLENISHVNVTVTMSNENRSSQNKELGTIVLGSHSTGDELRHWNDAVTSPGKHIAEWHDLCANYKPT